MTILDLENKIIFEYSQKNRRAGAQSLKSSTIIMIYLRIY